MGGPRRGHPLLSDGRRRGINLLWSVLGLIALLTGNIEKRYGFIYVDLDNQGHGTRARTPKDSRYWYRDVIASNGTQLD